MVETILIVSNVAKKYLKISETTTDGFNVITADKINYTKFIDDADYIIAGEELYTEKMISSAKRLKLISRCGHGTDNIVKDIVPVLDCRGTLDRTIAEVVVGYIIMCLRHLKLLDNKCRQGIWSRTYGNTMEDKTLGIIGYGGMGKHVGILCSKLDMNILHYDLAPSRCNCTFEQLLKHSDVITCHCDLNHSSYHLINENVIKQMKKDVIFINTSRGGIVNEKDLIQNIHKFRYVVLDVVEKEPLAPGSKLFKYDNIIFGSHSAGYTEEGHRKMADASLQNILNFSKKGGHNVV